ncbi:MAG TPA: lamin tail domain-containing protein, partial [Phycisphaerae bacterium]|nr:lamin tail domain-containing protein [Phycisphaerae bacterium]
MSRSQGIVSHLEALEPRLMLSSDVYISEFMAINDSTIADRDGRFSDWIEIHNAGTSAQDLSGWRLTDDADEPAQWSFPAVVIGPGEYLLVFASGEDRRVPGEELHTNFKLAGEGEYLALVRPDGTVQHEFAPAYPPQAEDVAYGVAKTIDVDPLIVEGDLATVHVPADGTLASDWLA